VLFLRIGHDRFKRTTRGYGVGLPIGSIAGVRYDDAGIDDDVFDARYRAWSVWIDPLDLRRRR
jgi:hypothetical protein